MTCRIIMLLLILGITAKAQNNLQTKKYSKMEQEIIKTITNIFTGVDERNWQKVQLAMAGQVLLDYTSMNGGEPTLQTPKEITDAWAAFLPGFDRTHHQISDFGVTVNGNMATVHYKGKGDHFLNNEVWTADGTFDTELQKQNNYWLVTKHTFNLVKQSGNTELPAKAKEVLKSKKSNTLKEAIKFNSDGLVLAGNLYKPQNDDGNKKYPAILVGGSWTTVKEQMSGLYAEELAKQGFITLAIDPRYFGESEGQPRFWENPAAKISDYKNAITYLETVPGVDTNNIFLAAICASAGYMANVVVEDKRVKGFATVAAWLHNAETVKPLYGGEEGVQSRIKQAKEARRKFAETGVVDYIPTVSKTDKTAAMSGDFDYYLNPNRGAIPEWSADKFAVMSWEDWLTFDPMPVAKNIQKPILMVHADEAALPDNVKKFFAGIPHDDKVLHWTEGAQLDFYDQPKQVSEAVAAVNMFLKKHLQ